VKTTKIFNMEVINLESTNNLTQANQTGSVMSVDDCTKYFMLCIFFMFCIYVMYLFIKYAVTGKLFSE